MEKKLINFGIDKLYIAKLTQDDELSYAYDSLLRLEGVQDLKVTEIAEEYTLQGDNGTVDVVTKTTGFEVEIAHGVLTYDELKILKAGEVVETTDATSGDVTGRKYITKSSDKGDFFGLIGVVESSNSKIVLAKVKAISVEIPYSNLTHSVVNIKAKALKRENDNVMRIMEQEGTLTAADITDFDA